MTNLFRSSRHTRQILVAEWQDAEELAAWYMQHELELGASNVTPVGADGGIDVTSVNAVAQVKHYGTPVGGPAVRQIRGAGYGTESVLFFALSGYTRQAIEYASQAGVALYTYNIYGDVDPVNGPASILLANAPTTAARRAKQEIRGEWTKAEEASERIQESFERTRSLKKSIDNEQNEPWYDIDGKLMGEFASFYGTESTYRERSRETAHRLAIMLGWARESHWLPWDDSRFRYLPEAIETAAREFITLYDELLDIEHLQTLDRAQWVETLHEWAVRQTGIDALVGHGGHLESETEPTMDRIRMLVVTEIGESLDILTDLEARWDGGSTRPNDAAACLHVLQMDPLGVAHRGGSSGLQDLLMSSSYQNQENPKNLPCYPLGSSRESVEKLRDLLQEELPTSDILESVLKLCNLER